MVIINCCSLCQPITFNAIRASGITLPLGPYLDAWEDEAGSQISCGLCAHIRCALRNRRYYNWKLGPMREWDDLSLLYNEHMGAVVVAASRATYLRQSRLSQFLCGEHAETLLEVVEKDRNFIAAFLSVQLDIGSSRSDTISRRLKSTNSGSERCLSLARRWLETCTEQHGEQCQNVDVNFVPNRLIDLSPEQGADAVRLVSIPGSQNLNCLGSIKYAALSYCWGTDPFLTTTSSNIEDMQQEIPLAKLPKTIQNAIEVVRYMRIKYLWVDSLCILQGRGIAAQEDWEIESQRMGQIYQSAYFTISAESAPAANVGIFQERCGPAIDFYAIPKSERSSEAIYLGQHQSHTPTIMEPLNCRGWAMQETILSRRLLRFGSREISWRCLCTEQMEARCEMQACPRSNRSVFVKQTPVSIELASKIHHDWRDLVVNYSGRSLSKRSDKLPAIAGLAKVAQIATGDAYMAGIWHKNASQTLLWSHCRGKHEYARKKEFQAPTWSWASVEGRIQFLEDYTQAKDLVVEFPRSKGPTNAGFDNQYQLSIKGSLLHMKTIRCGQFASYYGGYDNYLPWVSLCDTLETYLDDLEEIPPQCKKGNEGDPKELVDATFLFLAKTEWKLMKTNVFKKARPGPFLGAGLIIVPVEQTRNRYRRIGIFKGFQLRDLEVKQGFFSNAWTSKNHLNGDTNWRKLGSREIILI